MRKLIVIALLLLLPCAVFGGAGGKGFGGKGIAAGEVSFTPADLTGNQVWLEADIEVYSDAGSTLCDTDGQNVQQWNDQTSNGYDVSAGTTPLYKTAIKNSLPVVRFGIDGFGDPLTSNLDTSALSNNLKPFTIAMVIQSRSVTTDNTIIGGTSDAGISVDISGSHFRLLKQATTLIGSNTATISVDTWYILVVTYDGSGNYAFRVNGADDGSGTSDQTFSGSNTRIGVDAAGTGARFQGDMGSLLINSTVLSSGNIAALENYWNSKWGIY